MKKKTAVLALLSMVMVLFTGCVQMEMNLTLKDDNTGVLDMLVAFNEDFFGESDQIEENGDLDNSLESAFNLEGVKVKEEEVEYTVNDMNYKGQRSLAEFDNSIMFLNELAKDEDFHLKNKGEGVYLLEIYIESMSDEGLEVNQEEDSMEISKMVKSLGGHIIYSMDIEYEVLSHNADEVEGSKYIWDLTDETFGDEGEKTTAFIEFKTDILSEEVEEYTFRDRIEERFRDVAKDKNFHGKALKEMGLLKGTDKGLELDKELTRVEGAIVYSRLLDLEEEIEKFQSENPDYNSGFKDVPTWARPTIDYLHHQGLVAGMSKEEYGSDKFMKETEFTTLVLRALGYDDSKGDFLWNEAIKKAEEIGLYDSDFISHEDFSEENFNRKIMSYIAYNSLYFKHKENGEMFIEKYDY